MLGMPGAVRVILEPNDDQLDQVSSLLVKLEEKGAGQSLVSEAPQPAVLTFSLVSVRQIRPPTDSEELPLATLSGQISTSTGSPVFVPSGDLVSLVPPDRQPSPPVQLALDLDAGSFGSNRSLALPLPQPSDGAKTFEIRALLEVGGAVESPPEANDLFDFNPFADIEIQLPKIVKLSFTSAHNNMLDNNADLLPTGNPVSRIHWVFGKPSKPASHTMDQRVKVDIELELHPFNADEQDCLIEGTTNGGTLSFELTKKLGGGKHALSLSSKQNLPKELKRLDGDIEWSVTVKGKKMDAGKSFGHKIYLSFNTPKNTDFNRDQGITEFRIASAMRHVLNTGSVDPHEIIKKMMKNDFPEYTIDKNPSVDADLDHPKYFNDKGGAWRVLDHLSAAAECQAIVRVVQAILAILGIEGEAEHVKVSIDAREGFAFEEPGGIAPGEGGRGLQGESLTVKTKSGPKQVFPFLIPDDPATVPNVFLAGTVPSLNFFEACLKFTTDKGPNAKIKYYPGGTGGAVMDNPREVIGVFKAVIFCSKVFESADGKVLRLKIERMFTDIPRDPDNTPPDPPLFKESELAN